MKNPSDFVDVFSKEGKKAKESSDYSEEDQSAEIKLEIEVDLESSSSFESEIELIDIEELNIVPDSTRKVDSLISSKIEEAEEKKAEKPQDCDSLEDIEALNEWINIDHW